MTDHQITNPLDEYGAAEQSAFQRQITPIQPNLDAELLCRLWALYDAVKPIEHSLSLTSEQWKVFFEALANIPDSQHP